MQTAGWREDGKRRSLNTQRSIVKGKISEQIAPYLPGFPDDLKASDARFIGDPVDFVVFKGLGDKNIEEVVFVEVKSGRARLNANETSLQEAIEQKRVRYVPYRTPAMYPTEADVTSSVTSA